MGRRSLPKLDPNVDFREHLLELDELEKAPPASTTFTAAVENGSQLFYVPCRMGGAPIFPRPQPLELEIGCGKGLFLSNVSGERPAINFLGVEVAKKYARFSAYRLAKLNRSNARVVRGDGVALIRDWLPSRSLAAVHVYYPDPWWKARHRKRRVVRLEFAQAAFRALQPGGTLIFWTDVEEYFTAGCAAIHEAGPWRQLDAPPEDSSRKVRPVDGEPNGLTHFDRRMIRNEHQVFRAWFQKPIQ